MLEKQIKKITLSTNFNSLLMTLDINYTSAKRTVGTRLNKIILLYVIIELILNLKLYVSIQSLRQ